MTRVGTVRADALPDPCDEGVAVDDPESRVTRIERLIAAEPQPDGTASSLVTRLHRLCGALVRALPADAAGISLMGDGHPGTMAADAGARGTSVVLSEVQFVLGEGPCLEAFASRRPVLEPDLAGRGLRRWPQFTPAARRHGVEAVFAFPLQLGSARLGVLDILRDTPGSLSEESMHDATTFAEVAVATLLDGQDQAPSGRSAEGLDDALAARTQIYQAQGMTMIMLGVTLEEAMVRLRAHAYTQDQPLSEVAREVVAGRLELERDDR